MNNEEKKQNAGYLTILNNVTEQVQEVQPTASNAQPTTPSKNANNNSPDTASNDEASNNTSNQPTTDESNSSSSTTPSASQENNTSASNSSTTSSSGSSSGDTSNNSGASPTIPETQPNSEPIQNIQGSYSTSSVESIVNSLQLVYDDATGDYVTPPGGAPSTGVYEYAPIDVDNLYMGIYNGRLYFKITLGGAISATRQTVNEDIIESITFNIGIDSDGDLMEACATEAIFQLNIEYHADGQIWYNSNSSANCTAGEMMTHSAVYEVSGHGLAHTYNSGVGKNSIVFSHPLSELAGMVNVGSSLSVYVGSEAESNRWEHYSYDMNTLAGEPVWSVWTASEI